MMYKMSIVLGILLLCVIVITGYFQETQGETKTQGEYKRMSKEELKAVQKELAESEESRATVVEQLAELEALRHEQVKSLQSSLLPAQGICRKPMA